jgi:1-acyl-sn-glycerol-3-phosphate acyltransferase
MNVLRGTIFQIYMYTLMIAMGLIAVPLLLGPRSWVRSFLRLYLNLVWGGLHVMCGVTFEVRGRDHMPTGGALIAAKHQSMFETLAFWSILPDPAIILKRSLSFIPVFGWYAMRLGNISVDRTAGSKALRKMLKDATTRGEAGRQVLIFPEGTRTEPGENPEYKPGIAGLYKAMAVPCVPVALNSGVYLENYCGLKKPGRIIIEFLEPIPPGLDKASFLQTLHERIGTASDALL